MTCNDGLSNIYTLQKLEYFAEQGELDICLANLANFTYFSLAWNEQLHIRRCSVSLFCFSMSLSHW